MLTVHLRARRIYCLRSHQPLDLSPAPSSSRATFDDLNAQTTSFNDLEAPGVQHKMYTSVISLELEEILANLQILSSFPAGPSQTLAQRKQISYIVYEAEYRLIQLNQSHLSGLWGLSGAQMSLSKSYQLAVQIYVMVALRHIKMRSPLVQRYVQTLRSEARYRKLTVEDNDLMSNRARSVLLLWIETILAIATRDTERKLESVSVLRVLLWHLGCFDQQDFIGTLKEVCWLDGYLEDHISDIWPKARGELIHL